MYNYACTQYVIIIIISYFSTQLNLITEHAYLKYVRVTYVLLCSMKNLCYVATWAVAYYAQIYPQIRTYYIYKQVFLIGATAACYPMNRVPFASCIDMLIQQRMLTF